MPQHHEERLLSYTPKQLYQLVAHVEAYPEFVPYCCGVRVRERRPSSMLVDLMIGYGSVNETYTSIVHLTPFSRVDVTYEEGPFKTLENHWIFKEHPQGCLLEFYVEFEFKPSVLQALMESFFTKAVHKMVDAFEERAQTLYS